MRVVWFSDSWIPNTDGVVTSLTLLKKVLEKKGHEIFIFAPGTRNERKDNIIYYRALTFSPYPDYRFPPLRSIFSRRTKAIVNEIEADVIHSHSPGVMGVHAILAAHASGLPLLFTYHTFVEDSAYFLFKSEYSQRITQHLFRVWLGLYCRRCSCLITPSAYVAKTLNQLCSKEIQIIPNGIDLARFEGSNGAPVKQRYNSKQIILSVGRLVKEKNLQLLIRAAPHLLKTHDVVFIIVGKGPARQELEALAKKEGVSDSVVFTGYVSDMELINYYKAASVFAFPSTYETQGVVALEAMAAGLPVVAANARALPDIIHDGENGFLSDPYDPEAFAEKISEALIEKNVVARALAFVKEYSIEKTGEQIIEVYKHYAYHL